jgi:hypothetical protein
MHFNALFHVVLLLILPITLTPALRVIHEHALSKNGASIRQNLSADKMMRSILSTGALWATVSMLQSLSHTFCHCLESEDLLKSIALQSGAKVSIPRTYIVCMKKNADPFEWKFVVSF